MAKAEDRGAPHPWTCHAPVFRPTEDEFADFAAFVQSIEAECADFGIAKVVPPSSWSRPNAVLPAAYLIPSPVLQTVEAGGHGRYQISQRESPRITLERFERLATSAVRREGVASCSEAEAAALFWSSLDKPVPAAVMTGAGIDASRFPEPSALDSWNLRTPAHRSEAARLAPPRR